MKTPLLRTWANPLELNIKVKNWLIILVSAFSFTACSKTNSSRSFPNQYAVLRGLKLENAEADAKKAVAIKDFRFIAVRGYAIEVPGTSQSVESIKAVYGLKEIEGTGDVIESPDFEKLNANARVYAKKYNQTLLFELGK